MPKKSSENPIWTLQDLFQLFFLVMFLLFAMIYMTFKFSVSGFFNDWDEGLVTVFLYMIQSLVLIVPVYLLTVLKYKSTGKDFKLTKVKVWTVIKYVGAGFAIYYTASALFIQLQLSYNIEVPGFGQQESHIPLFGETLGGLVMGGVIIILIAPLVEELLFRGYIYQVFKKYSSAKWAGFGSAFIFAGFHLEFQVFIPLFILGLILAWTFERSKSLWTPIAFHMANNTLAFLLEVALFYEWIELPPV